MVMPCRDFLMIVDFSNANANKTFSIILHDRKVQKSFYSNLPFPQIAFNLNKIRISQRGMINIA